MIIKGIGLICVCFETSLSILFSLETILLTSLLMAETILLIMLSVWLLLLFVACFVVLVSGFAGVFGVTGLVGFGLGVIGFILMNLVGIWKVPVLSSTIIVVLVVPKSFSSILESFAVDCSITKLCCPSIMMSSSFPFPWNVKFLSTFIPFW